MEQQKRKPEKVTLQDPISENFLLRLKQILGDKKTGISPIIPVSKSTWWEGVASGRFPRPVRLSARTVAWTSASIRSLIDKLEGGEGQ